jgi:hypothetical protein
MLTTIGLLTPKGNTEVDQSQYQETLRTLYAGLSKRPNGKVQPNITPSSNWTNVKKHAAGTRLSFVSEVQSTMIYNDALLPSFTESLTFDAVIDSLGLAHTKQQKDAVKARVKEVFSSIPATGPTDNFNITDSEDNLTPIERDLKLYQRGQYTKFTPQTEGEIAALESKNPVFKALRFTEGED